MVEDARQLPILKNRISHVMAGTIKLKEQRQIAIAQTHTLRRAVSNAQLLFKNDMANTW